MGESVNLVTLALANVGTCFDSALTMIQGNALAMTFCGFPLIAGGIGLFRKLIHIR